MSASRFKYAALDVRGAKVRGLVWAESAQNAHTILQQQGLAPVRIASAAGDERAGSRVGAKRLAEFLHDIGALVGAGTTLVSALAMFRQQDSSAGKLTRLSENIEREIAGGRSVSEAFRLALGGEAQFVPALIAAGEASGSLASALQAAGSQIERDEALRAEFWASTSYPLFIMAASLMAVLLLLFVVVPSIAPLVSEAGAQAPMILRVMIAFSEMLTGNWLAILLIGLVSAAALLIAWRLGLLRNVVDRAILDGPCAPISRRLVFGRFAGVFGRLLSSGVPAHEAFGLADGAVSLRLAQQRIRACSVSIFDGARVSQALAQCRGFPSGIVRMAAVGEEAGALGPMIERAARVEQDVANRALSSLTKWLGPAMIVLLGVMIGLIMGGLLSGVSSLGETVLGAP